MAFPTDGPTWASDDGAAIDVPSSAEIARGFECGPVTPGRFNWAFQMFQSAIAALASGNFVSQGRKVDATEGIQGGGDLASDRTLRLDFNGLQEETSIANDDLISIYDASVGAHRKMTRLNFVQGLGGDTGGGLVIGGANIGTGAGEIFSGIDGGYIELRTIEAGGGIDVAVASDNIVVSLAARGSELTYA